MRTSKVTLSDRKTLVLVGILLFAFFGLLIIQFYKLQILEGDKWVHEAQLQHQQYVLEPFQRGRFFSNTSLRTDITEEKQPLVFDVLMYHLYVDPSLWDNDSKKYLHDYLEKTFHLTKEQKKKIDEDLQKKCRSRRLFSYLTQETKKSIEEWWKSFYTEHHLQRNALYFLKDYKRSYPFGSLLGRCSALFKKKKSPILNKLYL